ncbi:MAG: hypothetical protein FWF43_05505 [Propionibacteriaceae bacterium]|nr:hypothetical protein [Propionibacteriaceae bacterium]
MSETAIAGGLWTGPHHDKLGVMKRFFRVVLILAGIAAALYFVTHKQSEARDLWDEALADVPTP